jgi:hypothetical protein
MERLNSAQEESAEGLKELAKLFEKIKKENKNEEARRH